MLHCTLLSFFGICRNNALWHSDKRSKHPYNAWNRVNVVGYQQKANDQQMTITCFLLEAIISSSIIHHVSYTFVIKFRYGCSSRFPITKIERYFDSYILMRIPWFAGQRCWFLGWNRDICCTFRNYCRASFGCIYFDVIM